MGLSYKTIILLALFATTVDKFIFTPESFKTPPKSICMRFMGSSSVLSVEFIPFRFIFEHSIGFLGLSLPEFWSQMSWVGPRSRSAEKVQVDRVDFRELVLDDYWTVFNNFRCFGKLRFRTFFVRFRILLTWILRRSTWIFPAESANYPDLQLSPPTFNTAAHRIVIIKFPN